MVRQRVLSGSVLLALCLSLILATTTGQTQRGYAQLADLRRSSPEQARLATEDAESESEIASYTDERYGFQLRVPATWQIHPAPVDGPDTALTTISSFDLQQLEFLPPKTAPEELPFSGVKIEIGRHLSQRPPTVALTDWLALPMDQASGAPAPVAVDINGVQSLRYDYTVSHGYVVHVPVGSQVFFLSVSLYGPAEASEGLLRETERLLQTFSARELPVEATMD